MSEDEEVDKDRGPNYHSLVGDCLFNKAARGWGWGAACDEKLKERRCRHWATMGTSSVRAGETETVSEDASHLN